jgi:GT2 family glycosyltransferase
MKISIVTAYYNRRYLFYNTLKSIEKSSLKDEVEIIVVDDASVKMEQIDDFKDKFNLNLKIIKIDKKDKWWINPCIPFNIGFKEASGDVIILQNPECLHNGDIIKTVKDNIQKNVYLNFACYSVDEKVTSKINNLTYNDKYFENVNNILQPITNRGIVRDGECAWYNHPTHRNLNLHFCSAIMKEDLNDLGGFDERYAHGIGWDDNEFIHRIRLKKMNINPILNPFVIHQFHGVTNYSAKQNEFMKNLNLYKNYTTTQNNYKVNVK